MLLKVLWTKVEVTLIRVKDLKETFVFFSMPGQCSELGRNRQ